MTLYATTVRERIAMKYITRTFLTGLATVLPIVATFYLLVWLVLAAESILSVAVRTILPEELYRPGLGVAVFVLLVFLIGLFMRTWVAQKLFLWGEALLYRTPVVKMVYGALRDFSGFLTEPKQKGLQQVVSVQLESSGARLIGFVTREDLSGLPQGIGGSDTVAVYLPFSYQIGGYMVLVPRSSVLPVDMSIEDAMRLTLTAGISTTANRA
jgi:uncharacterized membrane protein